NVLTENAVSTLPFGNPVIRDSVFVAERGTSKYSYLGNASRYPVDTAAVAGAGLPKNIAGSLATASLAKIPTAASTFAGMVTTSPTDPVSILTGAGRYVWSGSASLPAVTVPPAFLNAYPSAGTIAAGASIKTASSATVYIVMTDKILPVGAGTIAAGASIKTASSATVYIVMTDKILPVGA
ncbi:hypothetical protein AB4Z22_42530, partial [Paenibacillus sp. TAF58]